MKIVVLCAKENKPLALDVVRLVKTLRLSVSAFAVGDRWQTEKRRLDELLASSSHIIVVLTEIAYSSSWLSFAAGFALGSERPLVLYRPSRNPPQAAFLSPFFLLLSLEDLSSFLEAESGEWHAVTDRRNARRELLELGVSFRGEAFADSVREGNAHAVDLFIRAGLPADTKDKKGVPVLCLAAREGYRSIVKRLLDSGASLDAQSEDRGNSALMDAVAGAHDLIVQDLIASGADLNLLSKDGQTALIIAVGKKNVLIARLLLEAGADAEIADKLGLSARKYAALFHDPPMISLFEEFPPRA